MRDGGPMRSAIFTSLIIFVAVFAGGYCILWYSQANNLRSVLERSIDQINSKEQLITYESITLSGFPWRLEASIMKPHFRGRVNPLIRPLGEAAESTLGTSLPRLPGGWNEELSSEGKIVFSVNTMANFYTLTFTGNWHHGSTLLGIPQTTYVRQEGDASCTMQLESGAGVFGMLWNFQSVMSDGETFLSHFRILNCRSGGISVTDSETREAMASVGSFSYSITHDTDKSADDIHFYSKITDLKTTSQGDIFIARYVRQLSPYDSAPTNFSINGNYNSELDIDYNGPVTLSAILTNPTFHFRVNNYDVSDDLYTQHVKASLESTQHSLNVSLNSELKYTELYDKQFAAVAYGVIQSIYYDNNPQFATLSTAFKKYTPEQVYSIIYPSLFKPSAFGSITSILNASYQGAPFFAHGALAINNAKLVTKMYGMEIQGTSDIENKEIQNSDLVLICTSCTHMANDLIAYLVRIQPTIQYFAPETAHTVAVMTANPDTVKKTIFSLAPLPNPGAPETLRFVVSNNPGKGITIGHKSIPELLALIAPIDTVVTTQKPKAKPASTSSKQ